MRLDTLILIKELLEERNKNRKNMVNVSLEDMKQMSKDDPKYKEARKDYEHWVKRYQEASAALDDFNNHEWN